MALERGTRFGPYEIGDSVGAGGMGEVYRARDTSLDRQVAIKVLPETFAADAERISRFEKEAKTLAALNHPNIAQIYGLERSGATTALVMELVEGQTLGERLEQGALPVNEAMNVAMQIVEALEAAHGQGIVHRDLKPANIKLAPNGIVKILDFGIAKSPPGAPGRDGRVLACSDGVASLARNAPGFLDRTRRFSDWTAASMGRQPPHFTPARRIPLPTAADIRPIPRIAAKTRGAYPPQCGGGLRQGR